MTRFLIREKARDVAIELTEVGQKQAALLEAFQECQEGRCDCPTDQYQKVSTMAVEASPDKIEIKLKPKSGQRLDTSQIATCVEHTIAKVETGPERSGG